MKHQTMSTAGNIDQNDIIVCMACGDGVVDDVQYEKHGAVCCTCYKDPATNNCTDGGKHLAGIPYEYICGECLRNPEQP